jgi:hypothetical protein
LSIFADLTNVILEAFLIFFIWCNINYRNENKLTIEIFFFKFKQILLICFDETFFW